MRELSRPGADEEKLTSVVLTLRILSLVVFLSFAPLAGVFFPQYSPQLKLGIALGALTYFFLGVNQVFLAIFQKHLHLEKPAFAELLGRSVQFLLVLGGFFLHLGLFAFLVITVVGALVSTILDIFFSRFFVKWKIEIDSVSMRHILAESLPIGISIVFTLVYFKLNTILLSLLKGQEEVGVFNVAYKILESVIFFPAMFVGIVMPFLSRYAREDMDRFRYTFQKTFDALTIFAVPLVVGGFLTAEKVVVFLGGVEFRDAASPLRWLLFATGLIFWGSLLGNSIIAFDLQRKATAIYFLGMAGNITLNFLFIPRFSYTGAAFATFLTELLVTCLLFILVWARMRSFPHPGRALRAGAASLPMGGALILFSSFPLFVLIPLGAFVYFFSLFLLRGVDREDLQFLRRVET